MRFNFILRFCYFFCALITLNLTLASAQTTISTESSRSSGTPEKIATAAAAAPLASPAAAPKPATTASAQDGSECRFCRWFELQGATLSARYRFVENSASVTTVNQMQHQEAFKGRVKLDPRGNYSLNAAVSSGNSFTASWNNTGVGTGQAFTNLYLKQLFFAARPVRGLEIQYGGLAFLRGESTEITSYDNDGYLMGERVSVKRPRQLFFDEVSVTYGYLGDLNRPNINKRFHRLKRSNYHQFLVTKKLGQRAVLSADYTFQSGVETLREAVRLNTRELRVVDTLRFENYQRVDVKPDAGFALSAEKTLWKKLTVGGGVASIDSQYGGLNADRFGKGKRLFASASYALTPELSIAAFATRGVENKYALGNRSRVDLIFSYNLLKSLQRTGIF